MLLLAWVTLRRRAVAYPGVGLPYRGVRLPSSSWGHVAQRWGAHIAVGCPTSVVTSLRCRAVSKLGIGLPTSRWTAILRRLPPLIVVGCRSSALGCPHRCGLP